MTARTAEIKLTVELDAERLPRGIQWQASDAMHSGPKACQSMMLSIWDRDSNTTAAIDLWTTDTSVAELNMHFHQVIQKLADTYQRATRNADVADLIREFGDRFAGAVGLP